MSARRPVLAAAPLLALPVVLAFFSGGYFDQPRLVAGLLACAALLIVAVVAPRPLPATLAGRCVAAALALLAAWTALSVTWAPLPGRALDDAERVALYLVVFLVAAAILRGAAARAVEPGLLAGIVLVCCYALSERVLPGLVDLDSSRSAAGRLEQPVTYWNAMGLLAALGLVLAVRGAGDARRPRWAQSAAAAAAPVTGAVLMLTFSRGAIVAAFAGLVVVALLTPTRQGAVAARYCVAAALAAAVAVALLPAVRTLDGDSRDLQGAVALVVLLALTLLVVYATRRPVGAAEAARPDRVRRATVAGIVAAFVALILVAAAVEKGVGTPETGATASRLASAQSNRYAYWRVAVDTFTEHPLRGIGSGGFRQVWLEKRDIRETVSDAHSLYLETAAELGLVGLLLLGVVIGGLVACGRRVVRADRDAAVGPVAALATFGLHAGLDWDWEMPAVTLIAVLLAAVLVTGADPPAPPRPGRAWAQRAAIALCAVAVAVPFAVALRSALLVREARDLIGADPAAVSKADAARALDLLHHASRLTPDSEPEVLEITLLFLQHRERESARVAERLVRDEPDNVVAWRLVAGVRKRLDPARAPAAEARVRALDPQRSR
jgi:O-antigen ligase